MLDVLFEPNAIEQGLHPCRSFLRRQRALEKQWQLNVAVHVQHGHEIEALEDEAYRVEAQAC